MKKTFNRIRDSSSNMSQLCSGLILLVIVMGMFLIMFSYAHKIDDQYNQKDLVPENRPQKRNEVIVKPKFTYACRNGKCAKEIIDVVDENQRSLESCMVMCLDEVKIWPKPKKIKQRSKSVVTMEFEKISFDYGGNPDVNKLLKQASKQFLVNLQQLRTRTEISSSSENSGFSLSISIKVESTMTKFSLGTDEKYKLDISRDNDKILASIMAGNNFGARHALETLSQLIWFDKVDEVFKMVIDIFVEDFPSFPYRGVMVDTARNFFPIPHLKRVVDGMAASKLNILHLHLTDGQSFPVMLPRNPQLAHFGAYNEDMVYTAQDIKDLVQYAIERGVKLVLEIDAPSHMNAGWDFFKYNYNEDYVMCTDINAFKGQINPDNEAVFGILREIYIDILEFSGMDDIFHIGGDEVDLKCLSQSKAFLNSNLGDIKEFWAELQNKITDQLESANGNKLPKNIIFWSSPLTNSKYLNDLKGNVTVQFWYGDPRNILRSGKSIIYSTVDNWYLDCGFGIYKPDMKTGNCDPYKHWQQVYKYRPWDIFGHKDQTLGGEVCLWSEQVEVDSLETRIWPRAAAFAERVWSDPEHFDNYDVYTRLVNHAERLLARGIKVSAMWPRWCSQNPGKC